MNTMSAHPNLFNTAFESTPGIYIPVLFIDEKTLRSIIIELNIFTIRNIDINEKTLSNGRRCTNAFIDVMEWHHTQQGVTMRSKLLRNEEVKIVIGNQNSFFICKRKHEPQMESVLPNPNPTYIDFNHIAPAPKNIKGVSRTPTPPNTDENDCPECVQGLENQLGHTCIQRMIEEREENWKINA